MKCKELWVKFANQNHHTEDVRSSDVDGCNHLAVTLEGNLLKVQYVRTDLPTGERVEKVLCYNFAHVKEYYTQKLVS